MKHSWYEQGTCDLTWEGSQAHEGWQCHGGYPQDQKREIKKKKVMGLLRLFLPPEEQHFICLLLYKILGRGGLLLHVTLSGAFHAYNIWWKQPCESDPFDLNLIDEQTCQQLVELAP